MERNVVNASVTPLAIHHKSITANRERERPAKVTSPCESDFWSAGRARGSRLVRDHDFRCPRTRFIPRQRREIKRPDRAARDQSIERKGEQIGRWR